MDLKVTIDPSSGFCFGVINAIRKAEEALLTNQELYCIGQIVHNDEEMLRLESKGLKTIDHKSLESLCNKKVLFRAHGEPNSSYKKALENKNEIIDASCPIILKLQERVKKAHQNGEHILIYGKHNHPEVIALASRSDDMAVVFEKIEELNLDALPKNITIFSQTTMSLEEYHSAITFLEQKGFKININDTICRQVSNRKENLFDFCKNYDVIIFVAGRNSSNGKVLYDVCCSANKNCYFVTSSNELNKDWFNIAYSVGIAGATSTPKWLMEEVKATLLSW